MSCVCIYTVTKICIGRCHHLTQQFQARPRLDGKVLAQNMVAASACCLRTWVSMPIDEEFALVLDVENGWKWHQEILQDDICSKFSDNLDEPICIMIHDGMQPDLREYNAIWWGDIWYNAIQPTKWCGCVSMCVQRCLENGPKKIQKSEHELLTLPFCGIPMYTSFMDKPWVVEKMAHSIHSETFTDLRKEDLTKIWEIKHDKTPAMWIPGSWYRMAFSQQWSVVLSPGIYEVSYEFHRLCTTINLHASQQCVTYLNMCTFLMCYNMRSFIQKKRTSFE